MAAFLPETDSEDELPPGWEERATLPGDVYYANHNTLTTQWTHPRTGKKKRVAQCLPFGWERQVLPNGKVLYVHHEKQKTTYSDPRLAFAVEVQDGRPNNNFRQRFDASTHALQIVHGLDLSGKIAIVTGANCGIGYETGRTLARSGCLVVLACRDIQKAQVAAANVRKERPNVKCVGLHLDLASLDSVQRFSQSFLAEYNHLDYLILNAGVFGLPHQLTEDNVEYTFQVNYLAHFYLAHLLRPALIKADQPKIIAVTAESHRFSNLQSSDDFNPGLLSPCSSGKQYVPTLAYNDSKLCLLMFAMEADRRWRTASIRTLAVHPGNMVSSYLSRHWWLYRLLFATVRPFSKSLQQAASSVVFSAVAPEMNRVGGVYINNCFPCIPATIVANNYARQTLWEASEALLNGRIH